jgi:hypothetical protein
VGQTDKEIDEINVSLLYPTTNVLTRQYFNPDWYISLILLNGAEAKNLQVISFNDSTQIVLDKLNTTAPNVSFYFYVIGRPKFYSDIKDTMDVGTGTLTRTIRTNPLEAGGSSIAPTEETTNLDLIYKDCDNDFLSGFFGYPLDCYQLVVPSDISQNTLNVNVTDGVLVYYSILIKATNFQIDETSSKSQFLGNKLLMPIGSGITELEINKTVLEDMRYLLVQNDLGQGIIYLPKITNSIVEGHDTPAGTPGYLAEAYLPLCPPFGSYDIQNTIVIRRDLNHIFLWMLVMSLCIYGGYKVCEKRIDGRTNNKKTVDWTVEIVIIGIYLSWLYFVVSIQSLSTPVLLWPLAFMIVGALLKYGKDI